MSYYDEKSKNSQNSSGSHGWLIAIIVALIGFAGAILGGTKIYIDSRNEDAIRTQVAIELTQTAIVTLQTIQPTPLPTSTPTLDTLAATLTAISQTLTAIETLQTIQPTTLQSTQAPTLIPTSPPIIVVTATSLPIPTLIPTATPHLVNGVRVYPDIPLTIDGYINCPHAELTGAQQTKTIPVSVPAGYIGVIYGTGIDGQARRFTTTVIGPYQSSHSVSDGLFCGWFPIEYRAEVEAVMLQPPNCNGCQLRELSSGQ